VPLTAICRRPLVVSILGALLLVPLSVSAQEGSPTPVVEPSPTPIASAVPLATSPDGQWTVAAFDPWEAGLIEPRRGSELLLALLDDGRLEGQTGCGRFNGGWSLEDGWLRLGTAPTGFVDCGEKQTEEAIGLTAALDAVAGWAPTSSGIELLDANGATRLVLAREMLAEPTGAWSVTRYRRPNGRLVEAVPERPMRLELGADGSLAGSTGCRLLEGGYRRDGASVIIGPVETVGLPCEGDDRKAERQLLRALGEVVYWERDNGSLAFKDGFDELLVELVPEAASPEDGG